MRRIGNTNDASASDLLKHRSAGDASDSGSASGDNPINDGFGSADWNTSAPCNPLFFPPNPTPNSDATNRAGANDSVGSRILGGGDSVTSGTPQTGTSSGGSSSVSGGAQSSGLIINVTYDASCTSAPAAFKTDVAAAIQYFESQITNPITININVGYGEVGSQTMGSGSLGNSLYYLDSFNYTQIKNALVAKAQTANDMTAIATLPASDPTNGGTFWIQPPTPKLSGSTLAVGPMAM